MERKKLTPQSISNLQPVPEGEYSIQDGIQDALLVRVRPSGAKSFQVRYRLKGGRRGITRRYTIGSTASMSLPEARKLAKEIRAQAQTGKDPAGDKSRKRNQKTVSELCDLYLKEGCETKKPSTIATDRGRIERHIKPLLGKRPIAEVSLPDIEKFMRDIAVGKTKADIKTKKWGRAIVEGGKGTATRTVGLLGGIFSFAVRHKFRSDNPVRGVKRYADNKGKRFLSAKELATLGEVLRNFEAKGSNSSALAIIRLLTFTGARKSEISALKWADVELERSCLHLSDSKTGAKVIPIGPPALAILAALKEVEGSPYVFPAETGVGAFQGTEKVWRKVRVAAKLNDVRIHDLRHSFASAGLAGGDALPIIGKLLGHADVKTTSRYAHLADDPLKAAATRISGNIAAAMDGRQGAKVFKL